MSISSRVSIRLPGHDYSQNGMYYVTLCTTDRKNIFGSIAEKTMLLNDKGSLVKDHLLLLRNHYHHVLLREYVIMPNHVHMIIEFVAMCCCTESLPGAINRAPTVTLGQVVGAFKAGVSRAVGHTIWQRNYYEHVIRNEIDYNKIAEYMRNNPADWGEDENNIRP